MKVTHLATVIAGVLSAAAANASITIYQGPGNVQGDENILFHGSGLIDEGLLVSGKTNQTGQVLNFFNAGTVLQADGGQAKLSAKTGTFDNLSIAWANPSSSYSSLILNINAVNNGTVTFNVADLASGSGSYKQSFNLDKNGENFFRIVADGNSKISLTTLSTSVGIQDIKQVRIGGAQAVPEPASMAALGIGALGLLRRRKKA